MLYKNFYSELGKLLYAVADIDGVITQAEKKALHEIVKKELVPAEKHTDEFGTDAAYYAEIEFEYLDEEQMDAEANRLAAEKLRTDANKNVVIIYTIQGGQIVGSRTVPR